MNDMIDTGENDQRIGARFRSIGDDDRSSVR